MRKKPLEERLRGAGTNGNMGVPAACWLYLDAYFSTLSEICEDPCYTDFYAETSDSTGGEIEDCFVAMAAALALANTWPMETATEILWHILAKPFADAPLGQPGRAKPLTRKKCKQAVSCQNV